MRILRTGQPSKRRRAVTLVLFVLLMPVMAGVLGLVVDCGLLMASQRQAQNAADAAALVAALDRMRGMTIGQATADATTYVQDAAYNNLPTATLTLNIPPASGPYAGNAQFAEAIVSYPVATLFIQVLGVGSSNNVQARAVAGYLAVASGEGAIVLDPFAIPGLSVQGGANLKVLGRVVVNSMGKGLDENGNTVDHGLQKYAATTSNNSTMMAEDISVVGGVDVPANFQNVPGNTGSPLHCNSSIEPDPLINLPTPTTSNGVVETYWNYDKNSGTWTTDSSPQDVQITGGTVTFRPGIYGGIDITGGNITFEPGIYVISPQKNSPTAIKLTGSTTVINGSGVMFYNTSKNYNPTSGTPDVNDGDARPSPANGDHMGGVTINASSVTLSPINDSTSVFDKILFYSRRWNDAEVNIQGNGTDNMLGGTLYSKWTRFKVSGQGTYDAQFVVGSMDVAGGADVTINFTGDQVGRANKVFLVE